MSSDTSAHAPRRVNTKKQLGWIEKTLSDISHALEQAVFSEEHTRTSGWLQSLDPRAKVGMFLLLVLAAGLSTSLVTLVLLYVALFGVAWASKLPFTTFVVRVWSGVPFFAGVVILPSIFFTSGERLFDVPLGALHFGPSLASILAGCVFIIRVGVSVSLAILLILTTPWADLLKSLHVLRVPEVFILLLSMTYRYIFLFLHTANGMFEARKSRTVGRTSGHEQRKWISSSATNLMNRSFRMSSDVYVAMIARGFKGEIRTYTDYRMTAKDWFALLGSICLALAIFLVGRSIG